MELVPEDADICVCTDLDEVFHPGWRAALEAAWTDGTTQAVYRYTWNFNADGSEGTVFWIEKDPRPPGIPLDPPGSRGVGAAGGLGTGAEVHSGGCSWTTTPTRPNPGAVPALLELSVAEAPEDDRNTHYLGREYLFYGRWDDCIRTLERHLSLPTAVWADERCASMRFLARAWRQKGRPEQARRWLWRAIGEAPHLREPYLELARLLYEEAEWDGVVYLCRQALAITDRPQTYICEAEAWGSLPWDLLSLGLYHTGRRGEALEAARQAWPCLRRMGASGTTWHSWRASSPGPPPSGGGTARPEARAIPVQRKDQTDCPARCCIPGWRPRGRDRRGRWR